MFDRERDFCWMTGNYSSNVLQHQDINATNYNQVGYNSNIETEATDNKWESRQPFKQACMLSVGSGSYRDWETDRKSTRLNSSHSAKSRMPSSA